MEMPNDDSDYQQVGKVMLPLNNEGRHACSQCGSIWWSTFVVFAGNATIEAVSLDATCARCGFPMMVEHMEEM